MLRGILAWNTRAIFNTQTHIHTTYHTPVFSTGFSSVHAVSNRGEGVLTQNIAILTSMAEVTPTQREDFHNNILKKKNKLYGIF